MQWLHWICINAGFETGDSPNPLCKAELFAPRAGWWYLWISGCRCVAHCSPVCNPTQPKNRGSSGLHDPGSHIHRGFGIFFCLYNICERWKWRNFGLLIWCTYVSAYMCAAEWRRRNSTVYRMTASFCRCGVTHNSSVALTSAGSPSRARWDAWLVSESPRIWTREVTGPIHVSR